MTRDPSKLSGLFVTGTDTGVGKTVVSAGLLRAANRRGLTLLPFKPAESGCVRGRPADAMTLLAASDQPLPLASVCPFRLGPPVAPAAAMPPGRSLSRPDLVRRAHSLATSFGGHHPILVECAGGLLSPYARNFTSADLAQALALPVLLVARNGLGTINHTALAIAELRRRGLPVLGIVLVTTARVRGLALQQNVSLITAQTGLRPQLVVPHFPTPNADRTADLFDRTGFARHVLRAAGLTLPPIRGSRARRSPSRFPSSGR
jgi:dethiobiotin synthetase